jgi:hypothetical protein
MTKCNTNRGKSAQQRNDEAASKPRPQGKQPTINTRGNNNNKQDDDRDHRKRKHGANTRAMPRLTMNKTHRQQFHARNL